MEEKEKLGAEEEEMLGAKMRSRRKEIMKHVEDGDALGVELKSSDMYWNIHAKEVDENPKDPVIILEWGWTAGMTEEQLANYAEDAPTGKEQVKTTLSMAKELRDQLDNIIKQHENIV
jgi:hypothetical protein